MRRAIKTAEKRQHECDVWNAAHPVGTKVRLRRDDGSIEITATRSEASVLGGHSAVIWLDGISGCYLLNRVRAINAAS